jgi:hypothetical protein
MAATAIQELQDSFLSAIRKNQEITLDAVKVWVEAVESITPKVPYARLPLADLVPSAHHVVAGSFDFAEQVLASQRRFADDVLKLTAPLLPAWEPTAAPEGPQAAGEA